MEDFRQKLPAARNTAVLFCERRFIDPHDRAATVAYIRDLCNRLDESHPEDLCTFLENEYKELCLKKGLAELGKGEVRAGKKMQALSAFAGEYEIALSEPDFATTEAIREARRQAKLLTLRITASDEQVKESLQGIVEQVTQKDPHQMPLFMALSIMLQSTVTKAMVDVGDLVSLLPSRINEGLAKEYGDFCNKLYRDETKRAEAIAALDQTKIDFISHQITDQLKADYSIITREQLQTITKKVSEDIVENIGNISFQGSRTQYGRKFYLEPEQCDQFKRNCQHFADKFEEGMSLANYVSEGDYSRHFPQSMKNWLSIFTRRVLLEAGYDSERIDTIMADAPKLDVPHR